ncbi:MAG: lysophospholipid acyltransferase family protein [Xanthobacteraceae bacterium]|nr:lysophospholipid acyltransferase family protein [Xanthobacteraceae bacterium]
MSSTQWLLSGLGAFYILIVKWTSSVELQTPPTSDPAIIALWHGKLALLHYLRAGNAPLVALISPHRDGRLISKCAWYFGIETVAGSVNHRNIRAPLALIRHARSGKTIFITPDGPRGPRNQVNPSVIELARVTRVPIVPVSIGMSRGIEINSWDRFTVPLPFSHVVVSWGQPILVRPDQTTEALCSHLQQQLAALELKVDQRARGEEAIAR